MKTINDLILTRMADDPKTRTTYHQHKNCLYDLQNIYIISTYGVVNKADHPGL